MRFLSRAMPAAALAAVLLHAPRAEAQRVVPRPLGPAAPPAEWSAGVPALGSVGVTPARGAVHAVPVDSRPGVLIPTGGADPRGSEGAVVLRPPTGGADPRASEGAIVLRPRDRLGVSTPRLPNPRWSTPPTPITPREKERFVQHVAAGMAVGLVVGTVVGTVLGARCETCLAGSVGGAMAGFVGGPAVGAVAGAVVYVISSPFRE